MINVSGISYQKGNYKFKYEYTTYEKSPYIDFPHTENQTQISTNKQNTNIKDKNFHDIPPVNEINKSTLGLINKGYIKSENSDIVYYNKLFEKILQIYDYKDIIIVTHYILNRLKGIIIKMKTVMKLK